MGDEGLDLVDGVEAKTVIIDQFARALEVIEQHGPARIAGHPQAASGHRQPRPGRPGRAARVDRGRLPECCPLGHPGLQPTAGL
jgi:hypothetical protein